MLHLLVLHLMEGTEAPAPWLERFSYGSEGDPSDGWPSFEEVVEEMDEVHAMTLEAIKRQTNLDSEATLARFRWTDTYRNFIIHVI